MNAPRKSSGLVSVLAQLAVALAGTMVAAVVAGTILSGGSPRDIGTRVTMLLDRIPGLHGAQNRAAGAGSSGIAIAFSGTGTASPDPSTLTVAPSGSMDGYTRLMFGQPWTDDVDVDGGHNGCGTRDDILARDLTGVVTDGRCKVMSGTLADPYTAGVIVFTRGRDTSSAVQIDHIVPLGNAWVSGAWSWALSERKQIANDPLNLLAVDGPANMGKGDKSADQWLPPNAAFQCTYVKTQVMVKNKYRLSVTAAEKATMDSFYGQC